MEAFRTDAFGWTQRKINALKRYTSQACGARRSVPHLYSSCVHFLHAGRIKSAVKRVRDHFKGPGFYKDNAWPSPSPDPNSPLWPPAPTGTPSKPTWTKMSPFSDFASRKRTFWSPVCSYMNTHTRTHTHTHTHTHTLGIICSLQSMERVLGLRPLVPPCCSHFQSPLGILLQTLCFQLHI